jgi:hypothetical protein
MAWWKVTYLSNGKTYDSDQIPWSLLPDLAEINIPCGHRFKTKDIMIESGRVRAELPTGSIWIDDNIVAGVPGAEFVILRKRVFHPSNEIPHEHIHIGLINMSGEGILVRITHDNEIITERYTVEMQNDKVVR